MVEVEHCNKPFKKFKHSKKLLGPSTQVATSLMGETLTVRENPKAQSTKPLETECGSRFRKEAVATLIA
jgi:hypothetical protein